MIKIRFLSSPKIPHDKVEEWKNYLKDSIHEVSDSEAERWLRRGVVEIVREKVKEFSIVEEVKEKIKEEEEVVEEKSEPGVMGIVREEEVVVPTPVISILPNPSRPARRN